MTLTAANYKAAVEILQRRFGSKQQIISKHMDILLNLDSVVSASAKALRHLYDHVVSLIIGSTATAHMTSSQTNIAPSSSLQNLSAFLNVSDTLAVV